MTYTPADVPSFFGLDLRDIEDAQGAIEATNCYVDPDGRLVPRQGFAHYGTGTSGKNASGALAYTGIEAFTNHVSNNSFETNTSGWATVGATISSSGERAYVGSKSLKVIANPSAPGINYAGDYYAWVTINDSGFLSAVQGKTVKFGAWVYKAAGWSLAGGFDRALLVYDQTNSAAAPISTISVGAWTWVTVQLAVGASATSVELRLYNGGIGNVYYDGILLTNASYTGTYFNVASTSSSSNFVVGYNDSTDTVRLLKADGSSLDNKTSLAAGKPWSFASVSGLAWGANGYNTLVQADKTDLSQPTCKTRALSEQIGSFDSHTGRDNPKPLFVGVQTPDNRLVAAGFIGSSDGPNQTATTPATVYFSQPTDPADPVLKWDETEYEIVGDANDPITGLANWGDYLIVFKEREWYVFYGNSVRSDTTGLAIFNYRRVEAGCTVVSSVAGSQALYVMDSNGNIRSTTGGIPQMVFRGDQSRYAPVRGQGFRAGFYIGFPAIANGVNGYLVVNEKLPGVFFWTLPLNCGSTWGSQAVFPYTSGLARFPEGSTDDGTAVSSTYTSTYSSWGSPGVEKSVRQTLYHGDGTMNVAWGKDLQSHGYPRSVTMTRGKGIDRNAVRGETLSYKITGSGFSLNRLVPMLREQRPAGVRS